MSGPNAADERVRRKDYSTGSRIQYASDSGNFLGPSFEQHARGPSVDVHDPDVGGYDEHALMRENSRTALSPSANDAQGFNLPPGAAASIAGPEGYLTPPQAAPTTSGNRVHYPPSPLASRPAFISRPSEGYSSVPLNDTPGGASAVASAQFTPYNNSNMGSRANSPLPSGANTPGSGGRRKPWSLFQGGGKDRDANASSVSVENGEGRPIKEKGGPGSDKASRKMRGASWDLLGDGDWEQYNVAKGSVENLRFAEGDVGTNKLSRFYYWAINSSIIVRWTLYIVPVLALLWIPGIVGLTAAPYARIWGSPLLYWSIWLTVLWLGFWGATAAFMMVPSIWRATVGSIIPAARKWTDVIRNLGKYAKLIAWMAAVWISFTPVVINHYDGEADSVSRSNLTTMANILFGLFLCSIVLGVEKLIIQLIALQFHQDSYEDRVADQKFQIKCLTLLYMNSHDIPGRTDTLTDAQSTKTKGSQIPKMAIRKALRGLREVAQTTTTALGNVASEMAGQSVLQTNSPANRVTAALTSANKSKALARRLFYSFRQAGAAQIQLADIARFFPDLETAEAAFAVFDKDGNGDVTRDEIESAVLSLHRDRLSLEASMRDLDGAVRRLDDIFMFIVGLIVILILAAMVTTKLTTLVTSAGTFVLGLSWLIGSTMQEILLSCIFLFVKHPYDVGDRVNVDGQGYTVAKMNLLSTSFKRVDGMYVWIGHNVLTTKVIENIRRSGATSETFVFEVDFGTSFETLQILRAKMLNFCKENARDFLPIFDVIVDDIPAQGKMVLKADIKYKSNWQQGALKVQRRNKWICALKMTLAELKILGPAGAGDPAPAPADPVRYTLVPWEEVNAAAASQPKPESPPPTFHAATAPTLTDRQQVVNDPTQDIWGDDSELAGFKSGAPSRASTPGLMTPATEGPSTGILTGPTQVRQRTLPNARRAGEEIEMTSAPVARRPQ